MHAPPSFQITLSRFGVWRWGCGVLVAAAVATTAIWAMVARDAFPGWLLCSVLLSLGAAGGTLLHAWRLAPMSLRWDGQIWHLGLAAVVGKEPQCGRLTVALDLGAWLLLRFQADGVWRGTWVPAQRTGHELAWHGLRATVYCARPTTVAAPALL